MLLVLLLGDERLEEHSESRIGRESLLRNKIPETRRPDCLCNGLKGVWGDRQLNYFNLRMPSLLKNQNPDNETKSAHSKNILFLRSW